MNMQANSDYSIWKSLQEGKREALDKLYQIHIISLYNYGKKISTDHDLVKDCIQDLFVDLWQQRQRISLPSNIKLYLFKALRYKVIHQKRKSQKFVFHSVEHTAQVTLSYEQDLITAQLNESQQQALRQAIKNLSARQREALQLKFFEGLTYEEIAILMNLRTQSIYNLIHQAVACLKDKLNPALVLYDWPVMLLVIGQLLTFC